MVERSSLRRSTSTRLAPNSRISPNTERSSPWASRSASNAGTDRITSSRGPEAATSKPRLSSSARPASACSISSGTAAMGIGTSSGCEGSAAASSAVFSPS